MQSPSELFHWMQHARFHILYGDEHRSTQERREINVLKIVRFGMKNITVKIEVQVFVI